MQKIVAPNRLKYARAIHEHLASMEVSIGKLSRLALINRSILSGYINGINNHRRCYELLLFCGVPEYVLSQPDFRPLLNPSDWKAPNFCDKSAQPNGCSYRFCFHHASRLTISQAAEVFWNHPSNLLCFKADCNDFSAITAPKIADLLQKIKEHPWRF
jgi:hypothetical protein